MFEISSQMREFVNFAQDAVANNAKNSIARLGKQESRYSAFAISAATDGDSVGKLRRSAASKDANNTVRTKFRDAVAQMFGGADNIPKNVLSTMNMKDYAKGKPLTADRILDVYAAIKKHISGQKNAALENDKREAGLYVGLVQKYVTSKGENEAGARLAAGDANAKIIASLVNGAKNLGQAVLKSISERSTSYEIAKAFADVFAKFRKLMPDGNYNDQFDRAERNAYLLLFAGVAMAGLNQGEKERMAMIFAKELAAFADTLAEWRESLESFRPAAAAAAEMKQSESAIHFSPDGFIEA